MTTIKIWKADTTSWETYTEARMLNREIAAKISPYISRCQSLKNTILTSNIVLEIYSEYPPTYPPNDFFTTGSLRIISSKIKEILDSIDNIKVEFFPVTVIYEGEEYLEKSYFLMHILDELDCFDFENSEYKSHQVQSSGATYIDSITKLSLLPVDTSKYKVFIVGEVGFFIICIDSFIADKITEAGATGVKFVDPSEAY
ncbi:hypothetical protein Osc7112_6376 (plasmid) [Oscillatoria nigro-viridis PCC 7112]|uniref:Immunity MXAN-0049 protein domain-containing protein n=1 Tax=Phormidium nigroviride PCC 7112 TaxID=179408 RepID=K9VTK6_9CYAN|nr:DUF1629 domain-containing protein [Oscillatoria nigro-viridis]AFZ10530.1 hypothetical protein Osc7112_6376 [Oscillatoria nigro-viridis PCC 7112]